MKHPLKTVVISLLFAASHAFAAEPAKAPVKFADALYPKFQHERCLNCHQFNSRKSNGRSYNSHRSRYLCDKCHTSHITSLAAGDWMAPPGSRMDYTGLSARDACLMIKGNSGAMNREAQLLEHMLHDVRIRWALEGGKTPMGQFPTVPGGYQAWVEDVHDWARDGMLCE
jgi:hypothetical protein